MRQSLGQSMQFQCKDNVCYRNIQDDIQERTSYMKSLCVDAESVGIQTVILLADQGERLVNINDCLTSIDRTLVNTNHDLNGFKSVTQRLIECFRLKFNRKYRKKRSDKSDRVEQFRSVVVQRRVRSIVFSSRAEHDS